MNLYYNFNKNFLANLDFNENILLTGRLILRNNFGLIYDALTKSSSTIYADIDYNSYKDNTSLESLFGDNYQYKSILDIYVPLYFSINDTKYHIIGHNLYQKYIFRNLKLRILGNINYIGIYYSILNNIYLTNYYSYSILYITYIKKYIYNLNILTKYLYKLYKFRNPKVMIYKQQYYRNFFENLKKIDYLDIFNGSLNYKLFFNHEIKHRSKKKFFKKKKIQFLKEKKKFFFKKLSYYFI